MFLKQTANVPADSPQSDAARIVAWRLHVRNIRAEGLPSGASFGRHDWAGLLLRFVAVWTSWCAETEA